MDYGREIQFGVFVIPATMNPTRALDVASIADEVGFDLIGVQDHPYQWRFFDTITLLTAMAMRTHRITLFPDVASLPMRPPAVLAKAAASIDVLSGGRFELGLGAGGFWEAIKAMGGSMRTPGESVSAVEEAIQVTRRNRPPTRLQRFITRVPPGVQDPCGNGSGLSGPYIKLLTSDPDSEQSRFHEDRFARIKMYVERRAARARR